MARLETFDRDIQVATAGLSQQAISAALAAFAKAELARLIASGEGTASYDRFVNGNAGAPEESVIPPGPILYVFRRWRQVIEFALADLEKRSPVKSGDYKFAHIPMLGGVPITNLDDVPADAEVQITNVMPYARKIEVGHMHMSVPPGVYEASRQAVQRQFGNIVDVSMRMVQLANGYVLKGHFHQGVGRFARTKLRRDTAAGQPVTYPALVMKMRA